MRAVRGLLLGMCWQLHEWGSLDKKAIKVDVPASTMTIHGKTVASVSIQNSKLKITWLDDAWKEWKELHDAKGIQEFIQTGDNRLKDAADAKNRQLGKGKGKSNVVPT